MGNSQQRAVMSFDHWVLTIFTAGVLALGTATAARLDKIEDQVTQIRIDVATLKLRSQRQDQPTVRLSRE